VSSHVEEYEEYRQGAALALLGSISVHLLFAFLLWLSAHHPAGSGPGVHPFLGHPGLAHFAPNLEVLEPNGLHFFFYQPSQIGVIGPPENAVVTEPTPRAAELVAAIQPTRREGRARPIAPAAGAAAGSSGRPEGRGGDSSAGDIGGGSGGQGGGAELPGGIVQPQALPALQPDVPFSETFVILKLVKPTYPETELNQSISARVVVAMHVTPEGEVDEVQVQDAKADPPGPTHAFELASLEALKQWRIGVPKKSPGYWLTVPIEFHPEDKGFGRLERGSPP